GRSADPRAVGRAHARRARRGAPRAHALALRGLHRARARPRRPRGVTGDQLAPRWEALAELYELAAPAVASLQRAVGHMAGDEGIGLHDLVTARALAALPVVAEYAAPLLRPGGFLVAWKGRRDGDEEERGATAAAQLGLAPRSVVPVSPFPGAEHRHLHVYE